MRITIISIHIDKQNYLAQMDKFNVQFHTPQANNCFNNTCQSSRQAMQ